MSRLQSAFVTGAGGFIGRHLVRQLLAEQVAVVALMMPGEPVPAEWGDRVRIVVGDVRRLLELREQIGPVDAIFHLAAVVSDWGSTQSHVEVTVKGTEHAIELALGWDAHFVVTTSVCAFASALAKGRLSEGSPVGVPSSAYEFCKQEQERVTREGVARGLKGTIVRPANVFGVGSMPWVNSLVQVMREGTARAEQGDLKVLRVMAGELALWFPQHAQSMDAALALHLRRVGFDPASGVVHAPHALPDELIHGCGGATCAEEPAEASTAA